MNTHDMAEIKANMANLRKHMPDADPFTCDFAAEWGNRLADEMYPEGANMAAELLLYDLSAGKSGFPSMPLPHRLTGQPRIVYVMMGMALVRIMNAVAPPEFATAFSEVRNAVSAMAAEV